MAELNSTSLLADANLVSYWRLEGNSNDYKTTNNGTDTNITYSAANGKFTQGAGFNGTSSKIAFSAVVEPLGAKTISFWAKDGTTGYIMGNFNNGATDYGIAINLNDSTTIRVQQAKAGSNYIFTATFTSGVWNHFCHTWDGTTGANKAIWYVNGISAGTGTAGATEVNTPTANMKFGNLPSDGGGWYDGKLDDVAIFNRVLTPTEVVSLYQAQSSGFFALL